MTVNHDVVGSSPTGGVQISLLDVGLAFLLSYLLVKTLNFRYDMIIF